MQKVGHTLLSKLSQKICLTVNHIPKKSIVLKFSLMFLPPCSWFGSLGQESMTIDGTLCGFTFSSYEYILGCARVGQGSPLLEVDLAFFALCGEVEFAFCCIN